MPEKFRPIACPTRKDFLLGAASTALLPLFPHAALTTAHESDPVEVAPGIFVHVGAHDLMRPANRGDISNSCLIVGNDAVAIVDTGGSYIVGKALREAAAKVTGKPIRYVINTHMHMDHVLGNAAFEDLGVPFVGHAKLPAALAARADSYLRNARIRLGDDSFAGTKIVLPSKLVTETMDLDLGGRVLTLKARPTAHTDNDLTVFDNATKTLMLGDLLFSEHIPTLDGSIIGWLKLIPELMKEPADRVIPGHGPKSMPWPAAIVPEQRYLETLAWDVRALIKDGATLEKALKTAGQSERGNWQLFDDLNGMNVTGAYTELEWE